MAIATLDQYIAALKERLVWQKTSVRTTVAVIPFSLFDIAGNPGAGALNVGNTANGVVPTDAIAGYPIIGAPSGIPYITKVEFASPVSCRFTLFDRLFAAGAYSFGADITLASQPSFSSRIPGGNDYKNLELWIEHVTTFTGTPSFQINYLDQDGLAGDTGVYSEIPASLLIGRCLQLPLASGDVGVSQITRVRCTVATVGTFNVMVLRRLWQGRAILANAGDIHDLLKTGMPRIWSDSALYVLVTADSTSSSYPEITMEVASA